MGRRTPRWPAGERGAFLLPVLVLTTFLAGLSVLMLQEGLAERAAIRHHETSHEALEIAEAGLVRAEMEIRALADPGDDGIGTVSAAYAGGRYDVEATRDPDLPDRWTVRARGERGLSVRQIEVGLRRRESGYWLEGLFSDDALNLNGTIATDSFDSRLGTWDSQATNADAGGPYAREGGHVGSNAAIDVHGTAAVVRGNAIPGPLDVVTLHGHPDVRGDMMPRQVEIPLPDPPLTEFVHALASNDNDQLGPGGGSGKDKSQGKGNQGHGGLGNTAYDPETMSIRAKSKDRVILEGGTYFFTDVTLSGQATLVVRGPSRIYVTGSLELTGGGVINETGDPRDCLVFAHPYALPPGHCPTNTRVEIHGGAQASAAVYAPGLDVSIGGNGDLYGSVVGKSIVVHGTAAFHYDEALQEVGGGSAVVLERLYWRELSVPNR